MPLHGESIRWQESEPQAQQPALHIRVAIAAMRGASRLSFRVLSRLGAVLGTLLWLLPSARRRVARVNLALCLPQWSAWQRERLLRRNFVALAQMVLEYGYCWFAPREVLEQLVRIEGAQHLHRDDGRPVILSMPHFTGLDLAGLRLSLEIPIVSVYSRQTDAALDARMRQGRLRFNTGIIFPRQAGIRPVIKAMKAGYALYYLPDQDLGTRDAVFADFFGVPAATITALSRLAAMTNAVVLPCRPRRERDGYTVVVDPPLADFPGADPAHDAQRMNHLIEQQVLLQPHQYFWLHRRFKSRPAGCAPVY